MTVEEHLKTLIGDLVFRLAQLTAENERLKAAASLRAPEGVPES